VLATNRDLLDLANSSCTRMQRLVDSLLDVSRLETGETTLSIAPVDLYVLLHEAVNREQLPVRTGRVSLHVAIPDDLPIVTGDAEKLDRVIANLIDNAIKYTPQGGQITIAARVDNSWLEVSVTDAGPGIPPDQRQRIFERFAQVTGEQPRRRGFGLGLAFCRLAVEAHGGQIWVEPGPEGVGSAFKFTLPL
jgi:signal transduction histidine kinase